MYVTVFNILVTKDYVHFATEYMMSAEGAQIIKLLLDGYSDSAIALNCGIMLRECTNNGVFTNIFSITVI